MRAKRLSRAEQFQLILECRQSGLTDAQWCRENNIKPSTFYNWISRLREEDYVIPESHSKECQIPNHQEVVRVNLFPEFKESDLPATPSCKSTLEPVRNEKSIQATMEIAIGSMTIRINNEADPVLLSYLIQSAGGGLQ